MIETNAHQYKNAQFSVAHCGNGFFRFNHLKDCSFVEMLRYFILLGTQLFKRLWK